VKLAVSDQSLKACEWLHAFSPLTPPLHLRVSNTLPAFRSGADVPLYVLLNSLPFLSFPSLSLLSHSLLSLYSFSLSLFLLLLFLSFSFPSLISLLCCIPFLSCMSSPLSCPRRCRGLLSHCSLPLIICFLPNLAHGGANSCLSCTCTKAVAGLGIQTPPTAPGLFLSAPPLF